MNNKVTVTMELSTAQAALKMKAIAKHFDRLATELLFIQNKCCPDCGSVVVVHKKGSTNRRVFCACPDCAYTGFHKAEHFESDTDWRSGNVGVEWGAKKQRAVDHAN